MKRAIIAVLAMLVWAMPAKALTVTFHDVAEASYLYTPGTNGSFSVDTSFLLSSCAYEGCQYAPTYVVIRISGAYFSTGESGCVLFTCPRPFPQFCSADGTCLIKDFLTVGLFGGFPLSFETYLTFPNGEPRSLLSSTITFTGPDPVPIPTALPLLVTAICGFGGLGWWRKRVKT